MLIGYKVPDLNPKITEVFHQLDSGMEALKQNLSKWQTTTEAHHQLHMDSLEALKQSLIKLNQRSESLLRITKALVARSRKIPAARL